jgi:hypothetical protein
MTSTNITHFHRAWPVVGGVFLSCTLIIGGAIGAVCQSAAGSAPQPVHPRQHAATAPVAKLNTRYINPEIVEDLSVPAK